MNTNGFSPGLAGVVAAQTRLSRVNGQIGELIIAGFPVEELASQATYEEVVYLLWHDRLPTAQEKDDFQHALAKWRTLPPFVLTLLKEVAQRSETAVMDALHLATSTIHVDVPTAYHAQALIARLPTIVASYWRLVQGKDPIAPNNNLRHAANFLYMLSGEEPSESQTRALETYLNTVVDHGLNASTFAGRVIVATESDMVSAITGAIGALKGPLHGGAPGPALDMVFEIGAVEKAETYLRAKLDKGERLMGFGHRVYKVRDPRAEILSAAAEKLFANDGDLALYELAKGVEETAVSLLAEYKPGRNLQTNVEFYTALLLHGLGLDSDLFTPTFACGRVAGWIAHCQEQQAVSRIIRPLSQYTGETNRQWQPIHTR